MELQSIFEWISDRICIKEVKGMLQWTSRKSESKSEGNVSMELQSML
jgi:hypothetical protein